MKIKRLLMVVCVFCLFTGIARAIPITTLYGTGVDDSGVVLQNLADEIHYKIINAPIPVPGNPYVKTSAGGFPIPPWIADNNTSAWIVPRIRSGFAPGIYTYQTTFNLAGIDPTTVKIDGQWATDNPGLDVFINGFSTGITSPAEGFRNWTLFSISSNFTSGLNTLDFVIRNDGDDPNPTGLRVELTGTGTSVPVPEPGTLALLSLGIALVGVRRQFVRR